MLREVYVYAVRYAGLVFLRRVPRDYLLEYGSRAVDGGADQGAGVCFVVDETNDHEVAVPTFCGEFAPLEKEGVFSTTGPLSAPLAQKVVALGKRKDEEVIRT